MTERCKNCGAELFAGQQFCRQCGTPTRAADEEPTQMLRPDSQQAGGRERSSTAPLSGPSTDPVYPSAPTSYQTPLDWGRAAPVKRRGSSRNWIITFIGLGVLGAVTLAALLFAISLRRQVGLKKVVISRPQPPPVSSVKPAAGESLSTLDEGDAQVSDDKTVITRTYPLGEGSIVSLKNVRGGITVEGWDEPRAEVRVIKRGGSAGERRGVRIAQSSARDKLVLQTSAGAAGPVEVEYEIMLPRGLRRMEIASADSQVEVSDVRGSVSVDLQRGRIRLSNIDGEISTKIIKGHTEVSLDEEALANRAANSFNSINGDVKISVESDMNADVKAQTTVGEIDVDDDLGLKVEKQAMGQQATGRIGRGGKPILVKVVNGNIRIEN